MIALQSTKDLLFPSSHKGIVTMTMLTCQNNFDDREFTMKFMDTCYKEIDEEYEEPEMETVTVDLPIDPSNPDGDKSPQEVTRPKLDEEGNTNMITKTRKVKKYLGEPQIRYKQMSYEQLDEITVALDLPIPTSNSEMRQHQNELFRQGFLLVTLQEIENGDGMYFSDLPTDWKILRKV